MFMLEIIIQNSSTNKKKEYRIYVKYQQITGIT